MNIWQQPLPKSYYSFQLELFAAFKLAFYDYFRSERYSNLRSYYSFTNNYFVLSCFGSFEQVTYFFYAS